MRTKMRNKLSIEKKKFENGKKQKILQKEKSKPYEIKGIFVKDGTKKKEK